MTVADIGAGTGYFLGHLNAKVGAEGKVLGLDIEPKMVAFMSKRAQREQWASVQAQEIPTDGTGLESASLDRVLIVNTWHHIGDREAYSAHLRDVLRPGGFVLVVDFTADSPHGPPREARLPPEQVIAELRAGGLEAELVEETLPNQYVVKAIKK